MSTTDSRPDNSSDPLLGLGLGEGLGAWMPIGTAPEGRLLVVGWLDGEDTEHPERHDFDWLEDGCWTKWHDNAEHVEMIGGHGVSYTPPYTHWLDLPAIPQRA